MYTIIHQLNGRFLCIGKYQDGTERWELSTLEEAVKSMKEFSATANGEKKLKKKHITMLREQLALRVEYVPVERKGGTTP